MNFVDSYFLVRETIHPKFGTSDTEISAFIGSLSFSHGGGIQDSAQQNLTTF